MREFLKKSKEIPDFFFPELLKEIFLKFCLLVEFLKFRFFWRHLNSYRGATFRRISGVIFESLVKSQDESLEELLEECGGIPEVIAGEVPGAIRGGITREIRG